MFSNGRASFICVIVFLMSSNVDDADLSGSALYAAQNATGEFSGSSWRSGAHTRHFFEANADGDASILSMISSPHAPPGVLRPTALVLGVDGSAAPADARVPSATRAATAPLTPAGAKGPQRVLTPFGAKLMRREEAAAARETEAAVMDGERRERERVRSRIANTPKRGASPLLRLPPPPPQIRSIIIIPCPAHNNITRSPRSIHMARGTRSSYAHHHPGNAPLAGRSRCTQLTQCRPNLRSPRFSCPRYLDSFTLRAPPPLRRRGHHPWETQSDSHHRRPTRPPHP